MVKGLMKICKGPYEEFGLVFFFFFYIYFNLLSMYMWLQGQSWGSSIFLSQGKEAEKSAEKSSEI